MLCIFLILSVLPAGAQDSGGIPPGTPANGVDTGNTNDPPDVVVVATDDCTVSPGASITLEDGDGTQGTFTDGERGITITAPDGSPRIEGPSGDFVGNHATFPTSDTAFDTDGDYTVVSSTGVTCSGGGATQDDTTPAKDQYSQGECANPRALASLGPEDSDDKADFETTTDRFRVTYEVDFHSDRPFDFRDFEVDITDRFGLVEFDSAHRDTSKSFIVIADPGRYSVETDVTPNNGATYTVTVAECPATPTPPEQPVNNSKGVIPGTGVKKIPPTGGLPLLTVGVLALLSAAVVAGRGVLRP